jgi:hypothetical protein
MRLWQRGTVRALGGTAAVAAGLLVFAGQAQARTMSPAAAGSTAPCGLVAPSTQPYTSIFVIMDENLTVPEWQASAAQTPYTHLLAANCRYEANAAGETHPSFPNYLAVASGGFVTCLACSDSSNNIFHQLDVAGLTWKSYEQSMPRNCSPNTSKVPYYRNGHNPAFWFTDLAAKTKGGDGSCATQDVPLVPNFANDLASGKLPSFAWVTPDDCRDMHWMDPVCNTVTGKTKTQRLAVGDAFVKQTVQAIAATPAYKAGKVLIVMTWDESNELSVKDKGNWGIDCSDHTFYTKNQGTCQVATILVSARLPAGSTSTFYSHYSLTRAIEQNFRLKLLGGATRVAAAPIY